MNPKRKHQKLISLDRFRKEREPLDIDFDRLDSYEYELLNALRAVIKAGEHLNRVFAQDDGFDWRDRLSYKENFFYDLLMDKIIIKKGGD